MACGMCEGMAHWEEEGGDGYVLARTPTGYVSLFYAQYFPGHTVFASRRHVAELHELEREERVQFLEEMAGVSEAICQVFKPRKLNYAALGNQAPHFHWSLIPRHHDDPAPARSPWEIEEFWSEVRVPPAERRPIAKDTIDAMMDAVVASGVVVERDFRLPSS
jgi:diadenosine tetraphosphate (Ap4A) HIT family hydrolase